MKRKAKKDKKEQKKSEEANGVEDKLDEQKDSGDADEESPAEDKDDESVENDSKKRKGGKKDKRKSSSSSNKKSKKGAAKKPAADESDEKSGDEDDAQYEVEEVLEEKMIRGVRHYLIRWKGYEPESDSWEPESTIDCADLIKKFKASQETQNGKENSSAKRKKEDKKKSKTKEKKVKKTTNDPEVDWDSNDEFEVERVIDVYFKRNGKREFLVSWKGYPSSQDSWEPEENLDCVELINKFMEKVEAAKQVEQKELRVHRTPTERFTLSTKDGGRRLSRRHSGKQRVHYHDAE